MELESIFSVAIHKSFIVEAKQVYKEDFVLLEYKPNC